MPAFVATTFVSPEQSGEVPEYRVTEYNGFPPHHVTMMVPVPEKDTDGEHSCEYCWVVYVPFAVPIVVYCCVV